MVDEERRESTPSGWRRIKAVRRIQGEMMSAARHEVLSARSEPGADPEIVDRVLRQLDVRSAGLTRGRVQPPAAAGPSPVVGCSRSSAPSYRWQVPPAPGWGAAAGVSGGRGRGDVVGSGGSAASGWALLVAGRGLRRC